MNGVVIVLAGLLVSAGLVGVVAGLRRLPPRVRPAQARTLATSWVRLTRRPTGRAGRRRDLLVVASVAGGFVLAALSGWVAAVIVVPGLVLALPYLLRAPVQRDVALLEAMDRWVRTLAATLSTGRSVTDAIRVSRRTAPAAIAEEVEVLVLRLNSRWETRTALQRFADALDSPDTDAVVAALMLAAGRGAAGAAATLNALAESIQAQLRARRVIEVERSKPYVVVRQVTVITLVTLGGMFLLRPEFFAGYRTPVGQVVLAVLVSVYLGSLLLMRRKARQPHRQRILVGGAP
ncbi:type II secretion system F family protein [Microlunatus antarcticus]